MVISLWMLLVGILPPNIPTTDPTLYTYSRVYYKKRQKKRTKKIKIKNKRSGYDDDVDSSKMMEKIEIIKYYYMILS